MTSLLTIRVPLLLVSELINEIDDCVVKEAFHPADRVTCLDVLNAIFSL